MEGGKSMSLSINVVKKNGTTVNFEETNIVDAVKKSARRAAVNLTTEQTDRICKVVRNEIEVRGLKNVSVEELHVFVEKALDVVSPETALQYRNYRNFKMDRDQMMKKVYDEADTIVYGYATEFEESADSNRENANSDASLVSTQVAKESCALEEALYEKTFLTADELKAQNTGAIYIHDRNKRRLTMNCCLFDIRNVLSGGFKMNNIFYREPKCLDTAFDVIGDIVLMAASQQYGGFTLPEIDTVLAKYAKMSYEKHFAEALELCNDKDKAREYALKKTKKEFEQGWEGWEYKFNTVASSRGDYPFITVTMGLSTDEFGKMCAITGFEVHAKGQGGDENGIGQKAVLFPKYVFLYDENLHGEGCPNRDVYDAALECSKEVMYPDWLSLTGEGYVPEMYKKYGKVISPMGCRAFLSPYYEVGKLLEDGSRDRFLPAEDKKDSPYFIGRFNAGAISLNLPLIYLMSRVNGQDFYDLLDEYLEMIRGLHIRTKDYLGNRPAMINPLAFCEGGFKGGNLKPWQKLKESKEMMESTTYSFGITALNELQEAFNGKSIAEDGKFALEVMNHIKIKIEEFKEQDHILYAIYGTPAESLCGKQIKQLRAYTMQHATELKNAYNSVGENYEVIEDERGYVIPKISDREYVSNSFHCHVTEDINGTQKQDLEYRFWNLFNGGKIQYVRYPVKNKKAIETMLLRAMKMGFYEGVNMALSYCDDCGYQAVDLGDVCPVCGSKHITKIDRMNGYLAYSRVMGHTRLNDAKMAEIAERKSM